jgi:hypothetical protein
VTTTQIGQLFHSSIEIEGNRSFRVEKHVKTFDEMIDILRSSSCVDCKNKEQSVQDLGLNQVQINGKGMNWLAVISQSEEHSS